VRISKHCKECGKDYTEEYVNSDCKDELCSDCRVQKILQTDGTKLLRKELRNNLRKLGFDMGELNKMGKMLGKYADSIRQRDDYRSLCGELRDALLIVKPQECGKSDCSVCSQVKNVLLKADAILKKCGEA